MSTLTEEEILSIIDRAVEKSMLVLPTVVGNLIVNHLEHAGLNKTFYGEHPEFTGYKNIVASVVELVDGATPGESYDNILKAAVPLIRERIKLTNTLNVTTVDKNPSREVSDVIMKHAHLGEL